MNIQTLKFIKKISVMLLIAFAVQNIYQVNSNSGQVDACNEINNKVTATIQHFFQVGDAVHKTAEGYG